MQLTLLHGYPDLIGRRSAFVGYGNGPASYVTGGDPVTTGQFGYYIDYLSSGVCTVSGTYYVLSIPSGAGPRKTWKVIWYTRGGTTEVTAAVNLSAEQLQLGGFGGVY